MIFRLFSELPCFSGAAFRHIHMLLTLFHHRLIRGHAMRFDDMMLLRRASRC